MKQLLKSKPKKFTGSFVIRQVDMETKILSPSFEIQYDREDVVVFQPDNDNFIPINPIFKYKNLQAVKIHYADICECKDSLYNKQQYTRKEDNEEKEVEDDEEEEVEDEEEEDEEENESDDD